MKSLYIITGASKGIGQALASELEGQGHTVLRMARTNPQNLANLMTVDLTDLAVATQVMTTWLHNHIHDASAITLINNAGTVEPMGVVGKMDDALISQALLLNVAAVIALTNAFVKETATFTGPKFVMNISSGAGRKSYEGWGVYGATKAAVDRFTEVLWTEQAKQKHPVKATSIAPGIIDTDMQAVIRSSTEELFPNLERFMAYKATGQLSTPEETAAALIAYLHSEKMGTVAITDIRD